MGHRSSIAGFALAASALGLACTSLVGIQDIQYFEEEDAGRRREKPLDPAEEESAAVAEAGVDASSAPPPAPAPPPTCDDRSTTCDAPSDCCPGRVCDHFERCAASCIGTEQTCDPLVRDACCITLTCNPISKTCLPG